MSTLNSKILLTGKNVKMSLKRKKKSFHHVTV